MAAAVLCMAYKTLAMIATPCQMTILLLPLHTSFSPFLYILFFFLSFFPVCVTSILSFCSLFPVCVTSILSFLPPLLPPFSRFSQDNLSYQVEVQCGGFENSLGGCNVTEVPTSSSCNGFMSAAGVSCNTGKRSHP